MEKLTLKNYNPLGKRIGDCVLRAFAGYFDKELDYETIKKEIVKYGPDSKSYDKVYVFDKFANEAGLVKIDCRKKNRSRNEVTTFNRAIEFAKQFNIGMVCISNIHAAYVDNKDGLVDTWDSRGQHMRYFYIHRDDAKLLGLEIKERLSNKPNKYTDEIDDSTWIVRNGKNFSIKSSKK